jgi:hypothetical protein
MMAQYRLTAAKMTKAGHIYVAGDTVELNDIDAKRLASVLVPLASTPVADDPAKGDAKKS